MYQVSEAISNIKNNFEGGNSLSVNYYDLLKRGSKKVLQQINPETMKRRVPIYGGVGRNVALYHIPDDVFVPSAIYPRVGDKQKYTYEPPKAFYTSGKKDTFTIEYVNGARFLVFRHDVSKNMYTLHEMDTLSGLTSDNSTMVLNNNDVFSGSYSVEMEFSGRAGQGDPVSVDPTTDTITLVNHGLLDGTEIFFYGTTLPDGIEEYQKYFVVNGTTDTFQIEQGVGDGAVDIITAGTAVYVYGGALNWIQCAYSAPIDLSSFFRGTIIIPVTLQSANDIERIEFVLGKDSSTYVKMTSETDSVGDSLIDGFNLVPFKIQNAVGTYGEPVESSDLVDVEYFELYITCKDGTYQKISIDAIRIYETAPYLFEYYSNKMFKDATTGAWKSKPETGTDIILLPQEAEDCLEAECNLIVAKSFTHNKFSKERKEDLKEDLANAYVDYWSKYPSSEEPPSYNTMEQPQTETDMFDEMISVESELDLSELDISFGVQFASNETPNGAIDGVNDTYSLNNIPNPTNSLMLWLNGVYQTQGVDYTLSGNVITFTTPIPALYAGTAFVGFYRY